VKQSQCPSRPRLSDHGVPTLAVPGALLAIFLLCLALLPAGAAAKSWEVTGTFGGALKAGEINEETQLNGVSAFAVNYTGAGGVPKGTVYAATHANGANRVARFTPTEKGLAFVERWEIVQPKAEKIREEELRAPYKICGPAIEDPSEGLTGEVNCAVSPEGSQAGLGIAVDQTTGNVYVGDEVGPYPVGEPIIRVYTPNGSSVVARFGEQGPVGQAKLEAETPNQLHSSPAPGWLTVNDKGEVYAFDSEASNTFYHRLMVFKPEVPGNYTKYVYAGAPADIGAGFLGKTNALEAPVLDEAGNVYVKSGETVEEYNTATPGAAAICSFTFSAGGISALTVDPKTGEPIFYSYRKQSRRMYELSACAGGHFTLTGEVEIKPERSEIYSFGFDPTREFPGREPGAVYAGAAVGGPIEGKGQGEGGPSGLGYILTQPEEVAPLVRSESADQVAATSARLQAELDPSGHQTRYAFQYIDEAAYQANKPDELQAVTVSAGGGLFGLGLEGEHFGGPASGTLSTGSKTVTALATATANGNLSAAKGTGTLIGASGMGTVISGSNTITSVAASGGEFEKGQGINGEGIPAGAKITAVAAEPSLSTKEITISAPATKSASHLAIISGTNKIVALTTGEGTFEAGQVISGPNIAPATTILTASSTELVLSKPVVAPGTGVPLSAGSTHLTSVAAGVGSFEAGSLIQGEGIPAGTEVIASTPGELTLSKPVTKPGTGVAVLSPDPQPLAVGEEIEGAGIPAGTTITAAGVGQLTLSAPATASGTNVSLKAGLPADADAGAVRRALEGLSTIGPGGVKVSGGPGDVGGSAPYEVTFTGALENVNVPELSTTDLSLTGGPATVSVAVLNEGGGGFGTGTLEAPPGGDAVADTTGSQIVTTMLTGLLPATGYRYRAVATSHCSTVDASKVCVGGGQTQSFHTYSEGTGLPDGRAYELVSPVRKSGGQVLPANPEQKSCIVACKPGEANERFPVLSSPGGGAIVYEGEPFGTEGAAIENEYLSRRTASGWSTVDLTPERLVNREGNGYKAFNPALDVGVFGQGALSLEPSALSGYRNLYTQPTGDPLAMTPLLTTSDAAPTCEPGEGKESMRLTYSGASADLSRIFFEANDSLIEGDAGACGESNLYDWSSGSLRAVNIPPGGGQNIPGAVFGSGKLLRSGNPNVPTAIVAGAVSEDGSRVFFTGEDGRLYVRIDGSTTLEVPSPGNCDEATPLSARVCFLTASADGSRVLLSDGELLAWNGSNYELVANLSHGEGGFIGVAGQSNDLRAIYFVDSSILTGSEVNDHGAVAISGQNNLYAWIDGRARFVAVLAADDGSSALGDWTATPVLRTAEASPDGRWLAFLSVGQPTGYENVGTCARDSANEFVDGPCAEAYVYDSQSKSLICASCNPGGAPPVGPTALTTALGAEGYLQQPRYLTDSGRLFFDSGDALVPGDTNGHVEDVYEFEPSGVGGCTRTDHCLSLVSSGHGSSDSNFLAMDESGDNVFFTTRQQLVRADSDELVDLYDARVGGGFVEPAPPSECGGEACQASTISPVQPLPTSEGISGEAKPKVSGHKKCKKGRVKRHGRCVKAPKKHNARHGAKKSHKNGTKSKRRGGAGHKGGTR
jgi:hypothetical protein